MADSQISPISFAHLKNRRSARNQYCANEAISAKMIIHVEQQESECDSARFMEKIQVMRIESG